MFFFTLSFVLIAAHVTAATAVPRQSNNDPYVTSSLALRSAGTDVPLCAGVKSVQVGAAVSLYNCRQPPCNQPGCQYNTFRNRTLIFEPFYQGEIRLHLHEILDLPADQKFCVEAPSSSGEAVTLALCSDSPKQSWWLTDDQHIASTGSGMCLDVKDGALWDDGPLQLWSCVSGNDNQLFDVIGYPELPYSYEW